MINDISFEPVIGDVIVKTEIITDEQMRQEVNQENLLYNPEMNEETKLKWHKERLKYFKTENETTLFKSELSIPSNYEEPDLNKLDNDEEFQSLLHQNLCVVLKKASCRPCGFLREDI